MKKKNILLVGMGVLAVMLFLWFIPSGCGSSPPSDSPGKDPASIKQLDKTKETAIKASLGSDKELAGCDIKIKVINLECTLTGKVENQDAKRRAEEIAGKVEGIKKVDNQIQVESITTEE